MSGHTVRLGSPAGRWVLAATVLGSGLAFLDATVVNVALPAMEQDLGIGFAGQQWVVDAYLLTLGAFLLLGGSLGDRLGRRRVLGWGVVAFAVASAVCGIAPSGALLVAARAGQGIAAAALVPASLAIVSTAFPPDERGRAIGLWSGLAGATTAFGPLIGGVLVDAISWRAVFVMNLPVALAAWWASRHVPDTRDPGHQPFDLPGAVLAVLGLGSVAYALIEAARLGAATSVVVGLVAGVLLLVGFVAREATAPSPMMPLRLFMSRTFVATNLLTVCLYGALSAALFLVVIHLQQDAGWSPLATGAALLPMQVLLTVGSAFMGGLATKWGPRGFLVAGPLLAGAGLALLGFVGTDPSYVTDVLPGVVVFGIGMTITVSPLTTTVMRSAPDEDGGIASGINNAAARVAGLLAIAAIPLAAGYGAESGTADGYRTAMIMSAGLAAVAAVLGALSASEPRASAGP